MSRRRISETFEAAIVAEPNIDIMTDNLVSEWGATPYPQLSVFLVYLKYLSAVHQNHHWITRGDAFYGDHLLFQRLYDAVAEDIDSVAEKAIGLGCNDNVDLLRVTSQFTKLVQTYTHASTIPQPSELARRSYIAEMNFLKATSHLVGHLKECGMLTRGLDNLLAGIEDKHEGHIYLLKQRITGQ